MSHASIELTRNLLAVSGWDDTEENIIKFSLLPEPLSVYNLEDKSTKFTATAGEQEWVLPAYDVSYFLRKLPPMKFLQGRMLFLAVIVNGEEVPSFVAGYYSLNEEKTKSGKTVAWINKKAETPEDALAMVSLELFKINAIVRQEKV